MNKIWTTILGMVLVALGTYGVFISTHPTNTLTSLITLAWGCYLTFKGCK